MTTQLTKTYLSDEELDALPRFAEFWQTRYRGSNDAEYLIYLHCADDGNGRDITNGLQPLKTFDEWIES